MPFKMLGRRMGLDLQYKGVETKTSEAKKPVHDSIQSILESMESTGAEDTSSTTSSWRQPRKNDKDPNKDPSYIDFMRVHFH